MHMNIATELSKTINYGHPRTMGSPVGTGRIAAHFGELLQGRFTTDDGPIRGLLTLPCPVLQAVVEAKILFGDRTVSTVPAGRSKAVAAAQLTLAYLGAPHCGALLTMKSNIIEGIGAGSSTGDVVATIHAVARALARRLLPEEVANLTIEAEQASDAIMFSTVRDPRLFAHRTGTTLEIFRGVLPYLEVIGVSDGATVDTLAHQPARYSFRTIREFDVLRAGMRHAITKQCPASLGAITTRSAEINQAFLPKPRFDNWIDLAGRYGASGLAVSHSGSAVAFLFDARDPLTSVRTIELLEELQWMQAIPVVRYHLGGE